MKYHINTRVRHPDYSESFLVRDVLTFSGFSEVLCVSWSIETESPEYFLHPIEQLSFEDGTPLEGGIFTPVPVPEGSTESEIGVNVANDHILDVPWSGK